MEKETKMLICPRCGGGWMSTGKDKICSCGAKLIETDANYDTCFDIFLNHEFKKLDRILQQVYRKYVFNSPEFDEDLFNKRQNEDDDYNKEREEDDRKREIDLNQIKCPKCGSTAVTAGQRGFNILTGFIGSGATVNRCAKCGYKWKP